MSHVYGCHNHPPYVDSFVTEAVRDWMGVLRVHRVRNTATKDCRYDLNHSDHRCKGCSHGKQPAETRSKS